jgi:hypothetical protein
MSAKLYGIENSNRRGADLWGKNQFNSTFPTALCCYMRDKKISPVTIFTDDTYRARSSDGKYSFDEVFNTTASNDKLTFLFESVFENYRSYVYDDLDHIDLIVAHGEHLLRPLEVKLTVLPDNSTAKHADPSRWGSELVIRPASIAYATLGIYHSLSHQSAEIRRILEPAAVRVANWDNDADISRNAAQLLKALRSFFTIYHQSQKPFLIQPVWRTRGKSPELDTHAFDVFVWTDFALLKTAIDGAESWLATRERSNGSAESAVRYMRSAAQTIRALNDLFTTGRVHLTRIFRAMSLGNQTDKAFALNGSNTRRYMDHPRLNRPALEKSVLREIILSGGIDMLSPERRFDATVYFTGRALLEK